MAPQLLGTTIGHGQCNRHRIGVARRDRLAAEAALDL